MKHLKTLFIAILMAAPMTFASAQSKIAHIDTQKLISEMPEVVAAQKQLEQLEKTYTTEIENTYKEFQTKAQTYSADAANQTDVTNQARQKELETMQQNINQYRETAAQDLQKKQVEMMRPLYDKAKVAIEKVAAAQGFDYVLDASAGGSVIMAKGKDLMADVKADLGF
ncbi:OmpH family outer membrane protein [Flavobacteriaceae bacterium]|jgi:outer membrane protein|nr:OmpH family outer membrane protein [Flavobacteriaceae bacterium]MDA8924427.1 OmpH family outer membrane protein [Flavobacteriaceae bacterium]MDA9886571.1 OmpH family outer membrane protein [Flavobacteriaceae bacterium]MDA9985039.1 OmpH family outer membrane protein [Flavobacteriaceae bacterium]MDB4186578.1 OmpH family outer membrane protein [Flavobacteriaceae bacterium]